MKRLKCRYDNGLQAKCETINKNKKCKLTTIFFSLDSKNYVESRQTLTSSSDSITPVTHSCGKTCPILLITAFTRASAITIMIVSYFKFSHQTWQFANNREHTSLHLKTYASANTFLQTGSMTFCSRPASRPDAFVVRSRNMKYNPKFLPCTEGRE